MRVLNWKTLRYFCGLALLAVVIYFATTLSGLYPDRRLANNASSSKSDTLLVQEKQPGKPILESHKVISEREKATSLQDPPHGIENLRRASSDLVLLGITKRDDGYLEAIIEDRQGKTQGLYTVGSTIRGVRVVSISRTNVILSVNGKAQVLDMNPQQNAPQQQENAVPAEESNWWENRSYLGYSEAMLMVRLKPFIQDGTQQGFEVKSIFDDSPLKAIGVEDGDIIENINGESIDSDLDLLLIDDAINNGYPYTLSVVRDGQPITLPKQAK